MSALSLFSCSKFSFDVWSEMPFLGLIANTARRFQERNEQCEPSVIQIATQSPISTSSLGFQSNIGMVALVPFRVTFSSMSESQTSQADLCDVSRCSCVFSLKAVISYKDFTSTNCERTCSSSSSASSDMNKLDGDRSGVSGSNSSSSGDCEADSSACAYGSEQQGHKHY